MVWFLNNANHEIETLAQVDYLTICFLEQWIPLWSRNEPILPETHQTQKELKTNFLLGGHVS